MENPPISNEIPGEDMLENHLHELPIDLMMEHALAELPVEVLVGTQSSELPDGSVKMGKNTVEPSAEALTDNHTVKLSDEVISQKTLVDSFDNSCCGEHKIVEKSKDLISQEASGGISTKQKHSAISETEKNELLSCRALDVILVRCVRPRRRRDNII